jgi:hypothetical protein
MDVAKWTQNSLRGIEAERPARIAVSDLDADGVVIFAATVADIAGALAATIEATTPAADGTPILKAVGE